MNISQEYDYIIIGSGFGGSVAAYRLSQKGYSVLVLEKGKRLEAEDFPETNWNLRRWMWIPLLRFYGFFKLTFFRHLTVLSGVGVGGGSLVYANVLEQPREEFFKAESWGHLAAWQEELKPFYEEAISMLGACPSPRLESGDIALRQLSIDTGKEEHFRPTQVGVFFGEPEVTVPDPYFNGKGPDRAGCNFCGGCMVGCRFNAKNSLDKNYLYLAEASGAKIFPECQAHSVSPLGKSNGQEGYSVSWRSTTNPFATDSSSTCKGVIFAGGVLGTNDLLLKLRQTTLPGLSDMVGSSVRSNSESLVGVTTFDKDTTFSEGIAIGSIFNTDEHSHIEAVRYPSGSGFWRLIGAPMVSGGSLPLRILQLLKDLATNPLKNFRAYFISDWAKHTQILLFMRSVDALLSFKRGAFGIKSKLDKGDAPTAFIPEAQELANKYADIVNGKPMSLLSETLLGRPTTAHVLGGAVMGSDIHSGVIDSCNRVFDYKNMYVCDGSMISANPGVNPSLTIMAITERAMSKIPEAKGPRGHGPL
jgi:cholesterol oxidase